MVSYSQNDIRTQILEHAKTFGASTAGIANIEALKKSSSHEIFNDKPYYSSCEEVKWPEDARSVLVMTLLYPANKPELDYWDFEPGRTPGNRQLASIGRKINGWLKEEHNINNRLLGYLGESSRGFMNGEAYAGRAKHAF